jgi:hypothetical protein
MVIGVAKLHLRCRLRGEPLREQLARKNGVFLATPLLVTVTFTSNARKLNELNPIRSVGSCVWFVRLPCLDALNTHHYGSVRILDYYVIPIEALALT